MHQKPKILIIDNEEFNLKLLVRDLEANNYEVITAEDGTIACDILHKDHIDVILIDRIISRIDGMQILSVIQNDENSKNIPLIMQTEVNSSKQIQEGIDAGVYYYILKPYEIDVMLAIIKSAISESKKTKHIIDQAKAIYNAHNLIENGKLRFRTLEDAYSIAYMVSNFCSKPDEAIVGILELMINAVEHGNLGITLEKKTQLLLDNEWANEINKRLEQDKYMDKEAYLSFEKKDDFIEITIEDMGDGFDFKKFADFNFNRATLPNGRGIAIAKQNSFLSMEYIGKGNKVICRLLAPPSVAN